MADLPPNGSDIVTMGEVAFVIKDGTVEVTHEVEVYDMNDLLADFGGMLGLLLGASVFGLLEFVADIMSKIGIPDFSAELVNRKKSKMKVTK